VAERANVLPFIIGKTPEGRGSSGGAVSVGVTEEERDRQNDDAQLITIQRFNTAEIA
jgi:hypothetical protein